MMKQITFLILSTLCLSINCTVYFDDDGYRGKFNFTDDSYMEELDWTETPDQVQTTPNGLEVYMNNDTDFWQKTYYDPILMNDNGHLLYREISDEYIMMETYFDLNAVQQYDQAGLMVRLDTEHWIKTGLEYVDGDYFLSVVVTNDYSDWSLQAYPNGQLGLRMYRQGDDFVIEAKSPSEDHWDFIRICHLNVEKDASLKMGLMACAPSEEGGSVLFNYLNFYENPGYPH